MTPTQKAIKGMLAFFESGNGVPVDKAVIRADCAEVATLRAASEALDKGVKDLLKRRVLPALQAENEVSPADVGNFVASLTGGAYYKNRLDNGDAELWVNTSVERLGYAIREALGPLTTAKVEIAKVGQLRHNIAAALAEPAQEPVGGLPSELGGVLTYTTSGARGVGGQTLGANGCGEFAVLIYGTPDDAWKTAKEHIDAMGQHGRRIKDAVFVPNSDGFTGPFISAIRVDCASPHAQQPRKAVKLTPDEVREIYLANGFTVKDGQTDLKPYVFESANAIQDAFIARNKWVDGMRAPADVPLLTPEEIEGLQEGIAVDDFAYELVRRTEQLVRKKAGLK